MVAPPGHTPSDGRHERLPADARDDARGDERVPGLRRPIMRLIELFDGYGASSTTRLSTRHRARTPPGLLAV